MQYKYSCLQYLNEMEQMDFFIKLHPSPAGTSKHEPISDILTPDLEMAECTVISKRIWKLTVLPREFADRYDIRNEYSHLLRYVIIHSQASEFELEPGAVIYTPPDECEVCGK